MTPLEYLAVYKEQTALIREAQETIEKAWRKAKRFPAPKNLRKAQVADMLEGVVVWRSDGEGGFEWDILGKQIDRGGPWMAFFTYEGDRVSLEGAFVEIDA
jgi:hypothetical protein